MADIPSVRLFVDVDLGDDVRVELDMAQTHYLKHVMRKTLADDITVFNGKDGVWLGSITELSKKSSDITITKQLQTQTEEPSVALIFASTKRTAIDTIVQKTTELGVSDLYPVFTEHSGQKHKNIERLQSIVTEAAEQSERMTVPIVHEAQELKTLLINWSNKNLIMMCDESGGGKPIHGVLEEKPNINTILIGPEGGFSKQELSYLHSLAYITPVGLGPRILRVETAAIAALSCWQAQYGDWNKKPHFKGTT